jgi:hypothetical protein
MKRTIILLACIASVAPSAFAQQEAIDQEINRLLSCGCRCFDYKTKENMDILTQDLSYTAQKLHRHVNDTTPCAKLRVYGLTQRMLGYADASSYDTVRRYALLYTRDTATQQETIDQEINRLLSCGCRCFDYEADENMDILTQDLSYSVQKLHQHVNDTTPCTKMKVHRSAQRLLNRIDSSSYDIVFHYNLLYARDTTNKRNYYNSIVYAIRNTLLHEIKLPPSVIQFIGSPEFYKADVREVPLLISYIDMYDEIENLKQWGNTHSLDENAKEKLIVALLRLGDSATTREYITMIPTNDNYWNWDRYILGLNYARTRPATERLISLLDNTEKIRYSSYSYSDAPQPYYTTVRTLALEILAPIIENFPLERVDVPYDIKLHFSEASEQDIKKAKRWLKKNKNYKIIRQPDYTY